MQGDGITVCRCSDGLGGWCYKASFTPTSLFGVEVDAVSLEGFGRTPDDAVARCEAEVERFYASLWA